MTDTDHVKDQVPYHYRLYVDGSYKIVEYADSRDVTDAIESSSLREAGLVDNMIIWGKPGRSESGEGNNPIQPRKSSLVLRTSAYIAIVFAIFLGIRAVVE